MQPQQDFNIFNTQQYANTPSGANVVTSSSFQTEIMSLFLQDTGTYNDMVHREYSAHMTNDTINGIVESVVSNRGGVPVGGMSSIAPSIMDLNARSATSVIIPNGWGERRLRFLLQARERSAQFPNMVYYTYIQGFSSHLDVTLQTGIIDPNTVFFVNSFVRIQESVAQLPTGGSTIQHRVVASGQLLNGVLMSQQYPDGESKFLRPVDVMNRIQLETSASIHNGEVVDFRSSQVGGNNSVLSNMFNNSPTHYMERLIRPITDAIGNVNYGSGFGNIVDNYVSNAMAYEPSLNQNPLLNLLERQNGRPGSGTFTLAELNNIDPSVPQKTKYRPTGDIYVNGISTRGNTAYWTSAEPETIMAMKLLHSIPSLMWNHYIGFASFNFTNAFGNNRVEIKPHQFNPITVFTPPEATREFMRQLEMTVANDISYNNNIMFDVDVNASIIGDIQIAISINGSPSKTTFVAPAFSSGILNPLYTHDTNHFNNFASNIMSISEGIRASVKEDFTGGGSMNFNI